MEILLEVVVLFGVFDLSANACGLFKVNGICGRQWWIKSIRWRKWLYYLLERTPQTSTIIHYYDLTFFFLSFICAAQSCHRKLQSSHDYVIVTTHNLRLDRSLRWQLCVWAGSNSNFFFRQFEQKLKVSTQTVTMCFDMEMNWRNQWKSNTIVILFGVLWGAAGRAIHNQNEYKWWRRLNQVR